MLYEVITDLAAGNRRLPVVLATADEPDEQTLLTALRNGLADVWRLHHV